MERSGASLAQELRRWAAEEMKLPPEKIPSESAARRMCSGQCAEVWKYVIRHVRHQRDVKKIRGNLLWYQQMEKAEGKPSGTESEKERRKQLIQDIARLQGELQQINLQIKSAQSELVSDEVALETAQEKIRDVRRRTLLLQAYSARVAAERQQLRGRKMQISGRLEQLEEMERKARAPMVFSGKASLSGFPSLEPEVLHDVQEACQLRSLFLKTLFERSVSANAQTEMEEQLDTSYQHWLSIVEKIVGSHPPAHILSALEHLALQSTQKLQELTESINIPQDVAALKFHYDSDHLEDVSDPVGDLPSVQGLIQEGWSKCEMLCVQHLSLQAKERSLSAELETVVQEMHRLLQSDGSERTILARAVFELELRAVRLRGYRDGLLASCRELDEMVRTRHAELQGLQAKRQRILDFRHLVNKKQQHIRTLIKGTSYIKSQLRKDQAELQDFVAKKLLPPAEQVALVAQQLRDRVKREVEQFGAIALPCLLRRELPGSQLIAAHELSIHRLNRAAPAKYLNFLKVCKELAFPLYKAPEQLLCHVVELKRTLLCLRAQLALKRKALGNLQQQQLDQAQEPDVQTLVREVQAHDQDQARELLPRVQRLIDQCRYRIEHWQELQAIVDDWWQQPGQFVLPNEQRLGLTLRQWLERWTLATKTRPQLQELGGTGSIRCTRLGLRPSLESSDQQE